MTEVFNIFPLSGRTAKAQTYLASTIHQGVRPNFEGLVLPAHCPHCRKPFYALISTMRVAVPVIEDYEGEYGYALHCKPCNKLFPLLSVLRCNK